MMPYIIILKVRKFHQPTANRSSTARKKPVEGGGGGGAQWIGLSLFKMGIFNEEIYVSDVFESQFIAVINFVFILNVLLELTTEVGINRPLFWA